MATSRLILSCATLCFLLPIGPVPAADWPTYRHDHERSGITAESVQLPLAPAWVYQAPQAPSPAWTDPAKRDYYVAGSLPMKPRLAFDRAHPVVIAGDSLYFGSSTEHTVNCLNASTGQTNWSFFTDGPVRMAPTVYQGKVYAGSDDGAVYCLEAASGRLVWKTTPAGATNYLVPNDGQFVSPFGVRSGVAVDQGVAYFASGFFPNEGVYLCAVDAETGQQNATRHWQRRLVNQAAFQGYILLSPSRVYLPGSRSNPFYFDRLTGATLGQVSGAMGTFALLAGNSFLFGPAARGGAQISETGDSVANYNGNCMVVTATQSYLLSDNALTAMDRVSRTQVWRQTVAYPYALILAGQVLFAGGENEVAAFAAASGEKLWAASVQGRAYDLAVAGGKLYISTDEGFIHCFLEDQSRKQSLWILF